jgi:hypothetical protein
MNFAMTVPMVSSSLFAPFFDNRRQNGAEKAPYAPDWTAKYPPDCTVLVRMP